MINIYFDIFSWVKLEGLSDYHIVKVPETLLQDI